VIHFLTGLAQAAPAGGGGLMQTPLFPLVIIIGIMYFVLIRPNAKKQKEHQKMLSELKKGDDVATQGGVIGKITGLKETEVTLQVQEGVRIRFLRSAITGVYSGDAPKSEKTEAKAS
jgi:preprotein translocase subunit YajC